MSEIEPFEGKQLLAYHPPVGCTMVVLEGAIRSSKTVVSLALWCKFIRSAPAGNLLMVGNTIDTLIRNVLEPLRDMLGSKRIRWTRSTGEAEILGRSVYIIGAHDEQARKRIQGLTLVGAYVDEVASVPESFWDMLTTRLSTLGALLLATCNPEGPKHWLLRWLRRARWWVQADGVLIEQEPGTMVKVRTDDGDKRLPVVDLYRVTFVPEDNAWMVRHNPGFIERMKASLTGVFYQRNIESKWVSAEGAIYSAFSEEHNLIALDHMPLIEQVLNVGGDYGDEHPTRAYMLGLGRLRFVNGSPWWELGREVGSNEGELVYCLFILAEFAPSGSTLGERVTEYKSWLTGWAQLYRFPDWQAWDPAALAFRNELTASGYDNVMRAHNAVLSGIQVVQTLIKSRRLFIAEGRAPHLVENLPGYVWDSKASERGSTEPLKENDDETDALRYSVYTSRRDWRALIPLAALDTPDSEPSDAIA